MGENPRELGNVVTGILDLADHYVATRQLRALADSLTMQAAGDTSVITVPAGEMWRVRAMSASAGMGAGFARLNGIGFRIQYAPHGTDGVILAAYENNTATAVVDTSGVGVSLYLHRPLLALPGSVIAMVNDRALAAPFSLARLAVLYEQMRV